jgi:hypothetical protein
MWETLMASEPEQSLAEVEIEVLMGSEPEQSLAEVEIEVSLATLVAVELERC